MELDIGNALASVASPGVSAGELEELDTRVSEAHEQITAGASVGEHGYAALALPETTDHDAILRAVSELPGASDVILVGIGGSALGAATIAAALDIDDSLHVLDNVDPTTVSRLLDRVTLDDAVVHVVSRSGRTVETMANFAVVVEAMEQVGVEWRDRTLITTGASGPLRSVADTEGVASLAVPAGVPGRYAALSTVGLPVPALLGADIEALLAGGQTGVDRLEPSLFASPAYGYGAVSYALATDGAVVNSMMPYADRLERFAEWFAQLWAESLGKDEMGQVPARALGVTDQHSQLQLYRAGPRQIQTSLVTVDDHPTVTVPEAGPIETAGAGGYDLGTIGAIECQATEASLAAAGRPNVRLRLDGLNERSVGELLVTMEAACMLAGELFGVDPFNQPAVEWGKRAAAGWLGDEATDETNAMQTKQVLKIPR